VRTGGGAGATAGDRTTARKIELVLHVRASISRAAGEWSVVRWARTTSWVRDQTTVGSTAVAGLVAAYGVATLCDTKDVPSEFWQAGHVGAWLIVVLGVAAGVGSFVVTPEQAAAEPLASVAVARDILKSPRGLVTEQTVAELRSDGFSGDVVEIARELTNG
jgi:hypothetical protein